MKIDIFVYKTIKPLEKFGLTSSFWNIHIDTLIYTWIGLAILFSLILISRFFFKKKLNVISLLVIKTVDFFNQICVESFGSQFKYEYFCFVCVIFFFTLTSCLVGIIPFCKESTADLNTAFALGLLSFCYVQKQKIKAHKISGYLKEFFDPLPYWIPIMFPLHLIGELSRIASMSFRLFGNILGGAIIFLILENFIEIQKEFFIIFVLSTLISFFIVNKFVDLNKFKFLKMIFSILLILSFFVTFAQMFFGIFEGVIQSFVLTMLTITYLSVGIVTEDEHAHHKEPEKS